MPAQPLHRADEPLPTHGTNRLGFDDLQARADFFYNASRFAEALPLYRRAANVPNVSLSSALLLVHKICLTEIRLRLFDEAMASCDEGLEMLVQMPGSARLRIEPILRQARGEALRGMGKPADAREEYTLASMAYQALANDRLVAHMQAEIGSTYVDEANYKEALLHYEDARRRLGAIGFPEPAALLVAISSVLTWLGKYDEALALQVKAERTCAIQRDIFCQALAAHVQGFIRYQQGAFRSAANASRRANQLFDKARPVEKARALNNLGLSLVALKRPEEARSVLKTGIHLLESAAANAKDRAALIDSLATTYRDLGHRQIADKLYNKALRLWLVAGNKEGERDTLANLGGLAARNHQSALSIFYYKLSINLAQRLRADVKLLERSYSDALTRRLAPSYIALVGELVSEGRLVEAHQVMRMLKEQELFEFLRRDGPAGDTRAILTEKEKVHDEAYELQQQRLFTLAGELKLLVSRRSDTRTPVERLRITELETQLQQANNTFERFTVALARELRRVDSSIIPISQDKLYRLQDTLSALGSGAVILHYVPLPDRLNIILTASAVFAIRPYTVPVSEKVLNEAIYRFREQIDRRDPEVRKTAAQLYGWLMPKALRKDLEDAGAKILMVSSAENLRYLPFSALYDGRQWLTERYAVSMLNDAATDTLKNAPQPQWSVRAFGMTQAAGGFPALAWVRSELDAIVGTEGLPGTVDFDGEFTLDRLHDALTQRHPPVLHIASHFVFRPGTEDDSFLLLGVGRLTLTDVKRMQFSGLDLLTLSACETAVSGGLNRNGSEVESFAALAQARGADAVLATLWSVDDISTAAFMQRFYRTRRSSNVTKVEALRATQLAMIRREITPKSARTVLVRGHVEDSKSADNDYSHPFYWAPFTLSGNWR